MARLRLLLTWLAGHWPRCYRPAWELPGVEAVSRGGWRARGAHRPDSDWDFGIYYRGRFDRIRCVASPGEQPDISD